MEINDPRTVIDFQKTTFCGHLRSHVVKVLLQNIHLGHADYACYWSLELLCSGLTHTLWMALFEAAALHINRANPNVFLYLGKVVVLILDHSFQLLSVLLQFEYS